jgi:hypothetical protein
MPQFLQQKQRFFILHSSFFILNRIFAPENVDDVPSAAHHVAGCATQPDCRHACPGEHLLAP